MIKIAFVGKSATGKSALALYLNHAYGFKRAKMMDGVQRLGKLMYGIHKYQRLDWRRQIEFYDALYKIDPNIHLSHLALRLEQTTMNLVVEDVRYIHEVQALAKMDFKIIRVTIPEGLRKIRIVGVKKAAVGTVTLNEYYHGDETRSYRADYTISNEGRHAARKSVDQLMELLGATKKPEF